MEVGNLGTCVLACKLKRIGRNVTVIWGTEVCVAGVDGGCMCAVALWAQFHLSCQRSSSFGSLRFQLWSVRAEVQGKRVLYPLLVKLRD